MSGKLMRRSVAPMIGLLLLLATGCAAGTTPTPTPIPTNTIEAPTATVAPADTPTVPPPTDTVSPATPTEALSTPTEQALGTATPAGTVGDYQWQQVGLSGQKMQSLALLPLGANLVLAAGPSGAWKSQYDFKTWEKQNVQMSGPQTSASVGSPDVMYVSNIGGCASGMPSSASRSTDGGKTWVPIAAGASAPMSVHAANSQIAYGTTCSGLVKSTDSGATWSQLPGSAIQNYDPGPIVTNGDGQTAIAVYYSEGGTVRVNRSTDSGATWSEITPKADNLQGPALLFQVAPAEGNPDQGGTYMTTSPGMLWFLPDGASDWKQLNKVDPRMERPEANYDITALYVDTSNTEAYNKPGPVVYTARKVSNAQTTEGTGVWRSTDGGINWQQVGKGLDKQVVNSLALAPQDLMVAAKTVDTLVAATDNGMWAAPMEPPFR